MTQTITDSSARPFGRAFIFPGRDSCAHAHGSLPFTCAPVSRLLFPPPPPQRVKARFSDKSAARGGAGEKRHLGAFRDGRHRQTDRPTASLQKPPTLRHTTHNPLWNRMLKCETYIYLFYFSFLAGTPAKNQEKNRAIVQQVFPCL